MSPPSPQVWELSRESLPASRARPAVAPCPRPSSSTKVRRRGCLPQGVAESEGGQEGHQNGTFPTSDHSPRVSVALRPWLLEVSNFLCKEGSQSLHRCRGPLDHAGDPGVRSREPEGRPAPWALGLTQGSLAGFQMNLPTRHFIILVSSNCASPPSPQGWGAAGPWPWCLSEQDWGLFPCCPVGKHVPGPRLRIPGRAAHQPDPCIHTEH